MKKATLNSIGRLHAELGPIFKALVLSQCQDSSRDQLEKTLESHPLDPSYASTEWPKASIVGNSTSTGRTGPDGTGDNDDHNGFSLDIPRMDLLATVSLDCVSRMVSLLLRTICYMG